MDPQIIKEKTRPMIVGIIEDIKEPSGLDQTGPPELFTMGERIQRSRISTSS